MKKIFFENTSRISFNRNGKNNHFTAKFVKLWYLSNSFQSTQIFHGNKLADKHEITCQINQMSSYSLSQENLKNTTI